MGSFTSKTFEDMLEVPGTPVAGKRVLEFDPRSPTVGITRTPIQVEKTPERMMDPRSPTFGIPRTPILNPEDEAEHGTAKQHVGRQRRHSFSEGSPVKLDPLSVQDALACLSPLNLDLEEEMNDNIQLIKRANSEPELNVMEPTKDKPKVTSKTPGKSARQRKTKAALFHCHTDVTEVYMDAPTRFPRRTLPEGNTRSPLGKRNVDVNSPLSIVKRKQANKLGLLRSKGNTPVNSAGNSPCRFEATTAEDKENLSM